MLESYVTGSGIGSLPAAVEVKKTDGTTATLPVDWNVDLNALNANAYGVAEIRGTVKGAVNPLGEKLTVSVKIGEVIPGDTVVFIDSVAGDPATVSGGTTDSLYCEPDEQAALKITPSRYLSGPESRTGDRSGGADAGIAVSLRQGTGTACPAKPETVPDQTGDTGGRLLPVRTGKPVPEKAGAG